MKKQLLALMLASAAIVSAQAQGFFTPTTYRGAFAPAPETPWTAGWTNFDPRGTNYNPTNPTDTILVPTGTISTNTTWTANKRYHIRGNVYVENGTTLTIEPGTVIRAVGRAALIIRRGAIIVANGTAAAPIVFTSLKNGNDRTYGDWAGLVICGSARNNIAGTANVEGDATAPHGGTNDTESSGVLRYVRIEFPGQTLTTAPNSEINGLSLYSVGSGTKIEYVQVSYSGDDSFEWFGGTVDAKYLVAYKGWDDDFDTDNGFRGRVQFAVSQRDPNTSDQSFSNGFESDNDANGSLRTPLTAAVFSNVTVIGPLHNAQLTAPVPPQGGYGRALHIRRNSSISVFNSIFTGWPAAGLLLDSRRTVAAAVGGGLVFKNNIIAGIPGTNDYRLASNSDTAGVASAANLYTWAFTSGYSNDTLATSNGVLLTNPFVLTTAVDFRPATGSVALTGASFTDPKLPLSNRKSLKGLAGASVSVYPNPASSFVNLDLNLSRTSNIGVSIADLTGRKVSQVEPRMMGLGEHQIQINTSSLSAGVYLITISNQTSQATQRLVIGK